MQPPAIRMNGKGNVIKSMKKNKDKYQDRVENYMDNLLPDRHPPNHVIGPRAPWENHQSCMLHDLYSGESRAKVVATAMRCLCCRIDACEECWDKLHGSAKKKSYNEVIQEYLPGVPLGESTQMITEFTGDASGDN
jgi:hypothetical protein